MEYLSQRELCAFEKQYEFQQTHKMNYIQLPACICKIKNPTIYHFIASLDLERWICDKCVEANAVASAAIAPTAAYVPYYIKDYPHLDTSEIKKFVIKNPECLFRTDLFIGILPTVYLDRMYNFTTHEKLDPWFYTTPEESHRIDWVLDALDITRSFCKNQIVKIRAQSYILQNHSGLFSILPPELWMYIFDFIDI